MADCSASISATYSATLLSCLPMCRAMLVLLPAGSVITTPMAAGPGFPCDPPSTHAINSNVRILSKLNPKLLHVKLVNEILPWKSRVVHKPVENRWWNYFLQLNNRLPHSRLRHIAPCFLQLHSLRALTVSGYSRNLTSVDGRKGVWRT